MATKKITYVCEGCGESFQRDEPRYCSKICTGSGKRTHYLTRIARYLKQFTDPDSCWIWTGAHNQHGYGRMTNGHTSVLVHRAAWECVHGPIPDGVHVLHHCDRPSCINVRRCLFLGTHAENMADMVNKGRSGVRGERHYRAVFTDEDIREIRASTNTIKELADHYGVWPAAISRIIRRERWKHVR